MSTKEERLERWRNKHQQLKRKSSDWLKLQEGPNIIRIVPPFGSREDFWIEREKSFSVGPNNKTAQWPSDPNAPFPLRDELARLNEKGDEISKKRAQAMRPKKRAIMFAVDRGEESKGAQPFDTNMMVLREILGVMLDSDYGDITDPETGIDLTINYTPGSKKTFPKWQVVPKRHSSPIGHPAALEEDLFEKYGIGDASEAGYVAACLEGSEEAYIASRQDVRPESDDFQAPEEKEAPTAPAASEDEAVKRELGKARERKAAKEAAKAAPQAPAAPAAPAPPPAAPSSGTPSGLLEAKYWACYNGQPQESNGKQIQESVDQGHGKTLQVMTEDQSSGWTTPDKLGFKPSESQVGADIAASIDG